MSQSAPLRLGTGKALVGRIDVPQVHISVMVAEGTRPRVLRVAVGHIRGTALPGQTGNVVLAAHRDTFFRRLGELKSGDLIGITVPGRQYLYSVRFTDVVDPNETWVLEPSTDQLLTLVTCYPLYYTGPAPKRLANSVGGPEKAAFYHCGSTLTLGLLGLPADCLRLGAPCGSVLTLQDTTVPCLTLHTAPDCQFLLHRFSRSVQMAEGLIPGSVGVSIQRVDP
jgi:LPXTG-site transpeptidase (sortase) family protein